ncbi:MAG TPA: lysylphosphatidylglycerol synthase transmembrane domain-containing protein [Polyangiaceae bacterium]
MRRHKGKLVASLLITVGIWAALHKGGLKIVPEGKDFAHVKWWTVPVYLLTLLAFNYLRSVRWRFLLRGVADVPKKRLLATSWIGFAAILLMPFRIGEFVRPYMIRTRPELRRPGEKVITMTAATSSVVAERIIDGLYLSIVLAVALVFVPTVHPLPDTVVGIPVSVEHVRMSGFAMLGLFCVAFTTIAVFYFARSWAHRMTLAIIGKVSMRLAEKLATTAEKFADGLHIFGRPRDAAGFLFETTLYWGFNALGMWLLAWGCGVVHADGSGPSFGEACALMGMLGCAILIPGPPGLLGVFQAGIYAGMTMYYPTDVVVGSGASYVFLMYVSQVVLQLVLGGAGMWMERGRAGLKDLEQATELDAAPADAQ